MDDLDSRLLDLLQTEFPLVARPYLALAERLATTEPDVIARLERLKRERIIRQISAIFDSRKLGYQSTLAAFSVPDERVEEVAAALSEHSGVSHSYLREHRHNLWFTLTLPPGSDCRVELDRLAERLQPASSLFLPVVRVFKIGVSFAMSDKAQALSGPATFDPTPPTAVELDDAQRDAVRQLQRDLPLTPEPFAKLAAAIELAPEALLAQAERFLADGTMRRFAAVLHHRQAGYSANGMACWVVPEAQLLEFGRLSATANEVSHAYERLAYPPDWPYNLFTMIHGRSTEDVRAVAARLSEQSGIDDYIVLFSTREFKKQRVKYFD